MVITAQVLKAVRPKINEALLAIGKEFDLGFQAGSVSYDDKTATFKLNVGVKNDDGTVVSREAVDFERCGEQYGFEAGDLNRDFEQNGVRNTIIGLCVKAPKFPVLVARADGKKYRMRASHVLRALGREVPAWIQ